jgi:hypothetical protein
MIDIASQLAGRFGVEPRHARIVNRVLTREFSLFQLPLLLGKLAAASRPRIPITGCSDPEEEAIVRELVDRFARMKPLYEAIAQLKGRRAAERILAELLVEFSVDWARTHYEPVRGIEDWSGFVEKLIEDKVDDHKIAGRVETPTPGHAVLHLPRCYYRQALLLLGLDAASQAICSTYEEYARRHQPNIRVRLTLCRARGDDRCRVDYHLSG